MGRVKREEIAGIRKEDKSIVCVDCLGEGSAYWESEVMEDHIITRKHAENADEPVFCDLCKKKL